LIGIAPQIGAADCDNSPSIDEARRWNMKCFLIAVAMLGVPLLIGAAVLVSWLEIVFLRWERM
jgi:hypothetical protein